MSVMETTVLYLSRAPSQSSLTIGGLIVNYFRDNRNVKVDSTNVIIRLSRANVQSLYSYDLFSLISGEILLGRSGFHHQDHMLSAIARLAEFITRVISTGVTDPFLVSLLEQVETVLLQAEQHSVITPMTYAVMEVDDEETVVVEGSTFEAGRKRGLSQTTLLPTRAQAAAIKGAMNFKPGMVTPLTSINGAL